LIDGCLSRLTSRIAILRKRQDVAVEQRASTIGASACRDRHIGPSTLAWNNITVRYKQAYLGVGWAVLKPLTLMPVCTSVRSFVEIPSGNVPYPILAFAALLP